MKIEISVFILLFGVALATPATPDFEKSALLLKHVAENFDGMSTYEKIETINEFVDMALTEFGYLVIALKADPLSLPDVSQKFTGGTLNMSNGLLEGVSQIYRDGDVVLNYEDRILNTDVSLIFKVFQLDYDYNVKMWAVNTNGKINGTVKDVRLNFKIDIDFKNLHITLVNFAVSEIEDITVKFEGGVLGSIANIISGIVTTIFKDMLVGMMTNVVGGTLEKAIDEINEILANLKNPPLPEPMLFNNFIFKNLA